MKKIAIFASGNGSNAENIIRYFQEKESSGEVALVVCNKVGAKVLERAGRLGVEAVVMSRDEINDRQRMLGVLDSHGSDIIVLAGFLLVIPEV
ncbi:MAG: phosphoribosylglycinamide formyltransferase, partial [Duncaniella sp.]|nr:phosphoribosylglycinamide formyltransferase [Duncaniella sp.]